MSEESPFVVSTTPPVASAIKSMSVVAPGALRARIYALDGKTKTYESYNKSYITGPNNNICQISQGDGLPSHPVGGRKPAVYVCMGLAVLSALWW